MKAAWLALRRLVGSHTALLVGVGLLFTFCRWPPLTGWDEGFYVAQLTSAIADRDLMLHNDLLLLANPLDQKLRMLTTIADDGALLNTFSIGPAVLHASYAWPLLVSSDRPVGRGLRVALALGSLALLMLTALAMIALCERLGFTRPVARVSAVLAIAFGPLALFGTRGAVNSHLPSALLAAVFCLALLAWIESAQPRYALAAGLAAGFLTITRWQDGLFLAALAPAAIVALTRGDSRRLRAGGAALAAAGFGIVVGIQLVAWHVQFDHWLLVPQGGAYLHWTRPAILSLLLSGYHGLVPWMPGFALGLLGMPWLKPAAPTLAHRLFVLGLISLVPLAIYLSACPADWWGGESYGPRRLSALTPLVALGLARVLTLLQRFRVRWVLIGLLALWSVFTLTAQLSRFDDLAIVFCGQTSHASPLSIAAYTGARWIDHGPTWPHVLRPGFTFSDAPRNVDRLVGLAAICVLALAIAWAWASLRRSALAQRAALGAALAWAAVAILWTARLPVNAPWAREWREAVRGTEGCSDSVATPRGFDDARHLVCAARAERAGDTSAALRHLALVGRAGDYAVDQASLRGASERNGPNQP
jgi:hypothetical protein